MKTIQSTINSIHNQTVKKITELHTAQGRKKHGQFIAEGKRSITDFIHHKFIPLQIYTTLEHSNYALELLQGLDNHNNPEKLITIVSDVVAKKISTHATPSNILGIFSIPHNPAPEQLTPGLVLANLTDPGNIGTLIRTAAALNIQSIVVINGADIWNPKIIQATAGALALVTIFSWTWEELLRYKKNYQLYALVIKDGQAPSGLTSHNSLVVVGNEAHGINPEWLRTCEHKITLPMPGNTESLNAAIAGSIALYLAYMHA